MSNMSHCRFQNTVNDMIDCVAALEEVDFDVDALIGIDVASYKEAKAMKSFVEMCIEVAEQVNGGVK